MLSKAEQVALLDEVDYAAWRKGKGEDWFSKAEHDWSFWQRPEQAPPGGDWRVWLVMAGRGFGKTRLGAEWIRGRAEADGSLRIALVGATLHEVRQIMLEGDSGLLNICPEDKRPHYEPSLRRLEWPNGAIASLYSTSEPDSLRGPQHHIAWCDEIAKWEKAEETWNNLMMTMRLSEKPHIVATTTPQTVALIRRLKVEEGVVRTGGHTNDNSAHMPTEWRRVMTNLFGGTRLGRQELAGELLEDAEHALWKRAVIEDTRVSAFPAMRRVVVGVDPPAGVGGDACGIIAAGLGVDGHYYVLADHSVAGKTPEGWARAVAAAALDWEADRVIAEANNGGAMVETTLQAADIAMPVKLVHASRGKMTRAEPISTIYEAGKVHHCGRFPALEDELCGFIAGGRYEGPGRSPDRADACVWALTELLMGRKGVEPRVRVL